MPRPCIISVCNAKGGVGKSTITINLSTVMASRGARSVLVVDMDPQCNTTAFFSQGGLGLYPRTLYEVISDQVDNPTDEYIHSHIYSTDYRGVDILPNSEMVSAIELGLITSLVNPDLMKPQLLHRLRTFLRDYALRNYDVVLIDCPPSLGLWSINALICSDFVIVPIESTSTRSLEGLNLALKAISNIKKSNNPDLKFLRLLINKVDKRKTSSKQLMSRVYDKYGKDNCFDTTISNHDSFNESEAGKIPVISHSPHSNAATQLRDLGKEIFEIIEEEYEWKG